MIAVCLSFIISGCIKRQDPKIQLEKIYREYDVKSFTTDVEIFPFEDDYTKICIKNPANDNILISLNVSFISEETLSLKSCKISYQKDFIIIEPNDSRNIIVYNFNEKLQNLENVKGIEYHKIHGIGRYTFGKDAIPFVQYVNNKKANPTHSSMNSRESGDGGPKIQCKNGGCGATEYTYKSGQIASTGGAEGGVSCGTGYFACCNATDDCKCIDNKKGGCN